MGGDEINVLEPGADYGWPLVAYGRNYDGSTIGLGVGHKEGYEDPVHHWDPSIAPSGLALYLGDNTVMRLLSSGLKASICGVAAVAPPR